MLNDGKGVWDFIKEVIVERIENYYKILYKLRKWKVNYDFD